MSGIGKLIQQIQDKNRADRQQQHTQTVSLSQESHQKLIKLSESLQLSKTNLASQLLAVAIDEAAANMFSPKQTLQEMMSPSPVSDMLPQLEARSKSKK